VPPTEFQISRNSQAAYLTAVCKDRLSVFTGEAINTVACNALDEARASGGFLIFAYVLMPDHLHLLTSAPTGESDVTRYTKGITGRRVIDYLKEQNLDSILRRLQHQEWKRKHSHSLWQQEKNLLSIYSEALFMEKVNYIHNNPVRAGLVEKPTDYLWSSARIWRREDREDEPLMVDIDKIRWRG
jgi:REP element-mobilizing transposase RayT